MTVDQLVAQLIAAQKAGLGPARVLTASLNNEEPDELVVRVRTYRGQASVILISDTKP